MTESHHISRRRLLEAGGVIGASNFLPQASWSQEIKEGPSGKLALIGGSIISRLDENREDDGDYHIDPHRIMRRLRDEVGGFKDKTVVVVTCASGTPVKNAGEYRNEFLQLGAGHVVTVTNEEEARAPELAHIINDKKTAMVFFGGGDQVDLVNQFGGSDAHKAALARYRDDANFVVAGTSAGAAAMAKKMIYKGKDDIDGLGFIDARIDTHVNEKHIGHYDAEGKYVVDDDAPLRETERITDALKKDKGGFGIALDGAMGVLIAGGKVHAFGYPDYRAQFVHLEGEAAAKTSVMKAGAELPMTALLKPAAATIAAMP